MRVRWLSIVFAVYLAWLPSAVQAETVLENIRNNGVLKVGIREDAVPFGFLDANENLSGLCLDFVNILLQEVKQTLQRDAILVKIFKSTLFNRFDLVSDRVINLECGPNTIRDAVDYQIAFSQPFFITGTQFLIRAEDENQFKSRASLQDAVIGVLRNTTNKTVIENRFPLAQLREFQGPTGRLRGVQALQQGKINAFASDGILLVGEAALQGLVLGQSYRIVPQDPLDCESYGMILPNNDYQWQELVNKSILKAREVRLFREWLGVVLPEIQEVLSYCDRQKTIPSQ